MVKELTEEAGLEGKFTNHSLRATCASRMFDNFVPEQIIKETTVHKSECVRVYKQTSEVLQEVASKTLGEELPKKKIKLDEDSECEDGKFVDCDNEYLSYAKMVENVNKTKQEIQKKLYPKSWLKAKKLLNKAKKFTIDLNLNMKVSK